MSFDLAMKVTPRLGQVPICPRCGGRHVEFAFVQAGFVKCEDCGYSQTSVGQVRSTGGGDLLGGLIAIGLLALGAAVIGSILDDLGGKSNSRQLPSIDEENWRKAVR